jgi:amino acid transporter
MSTLSWQAGNASGSFLTGTIIQALVTVNYPDTYEPKPFHGTLLVFACVALIFSVNVYASHIWPYLQNGLMALHVLGFLVTIIVLWVCAPHQSAKAVFTEFTNEGGWPTMGLSLMVGQITAIFSLLGTFCVIRYHKISANESTGSDATAHMAEEVRDAARYVPISIFWSYFGNGLMAIIFLITYLFSIASVPDALADPTGYPFLYVFKSAVSTAGVNALTSLLLTLVIAANISFNASTSRQTFAFARDRGLPFSDWIGEVHPTKEIPVNAIITTCIITMLLSLINLGSLVAFNAIISLQVCALMMTYGCSVACILYRRLAHPELLPKARWSLGRYGIAVNCLGLAYVSFVFFWSFWPNTTPVELESFNWSVVLFLGVLVCALGMFLVKGRLVYTGPVKLVRDIRVG